MDFNFTMSTGSWIIGKALHGLFPGQYYEEVDAGQTFQASHLKVTKEQLNKAISEVKIVVSSKQEQHEAVNVITMLEEPSGNRFKLDSAMWIVFKDWVKTHGEVLFEDENTIEVKEENSVST